MATFDPQVQTGYDPQYWYWARSAQEPTPIRSVADPSLKNVATGIEEGASFADTAIKQGINQDIQNRVDKERNAFTSALETVSGRQPSPSGNPMDAMDLMPSNQPQAPAAVNNQLSRIKNLQNSYTGNKISETTYYQNLNSILKDVRSQYPGYRDYVDSEVSKVTGVNPANAYMASMVHDVNAARSQAAAEQNYYTKQIVNSGFSGSQQMLAAYQAGKIPTAGVQKWLAQGNERIEGMKEQAAAFALSDKARSDYQARAEITAQTAAQHAATEYYSGTHFLRNDPNSPTSSSISDMINQSIANPGSIDAVKIRQAGMQYQQMKARNYAETLQYLQSVKDKNGVSVADVLGPAKLKSIMDSTIGMLYDTQTQAMTNGDLGIVHAVQNAAVDVGNNAAYRMLGDPTLGGVISTFSALNKLAPNLSPELTTNLVGAYNQGKNGGSGDIGVDLYNFAQHQGRQAVTQTGGIGGAPYTFNQSQKELTGAAAATASSTAIHAQAIKNLLDLSKAVTEKDPTVQDNAIKYFYGAANDGSLNKLMDDYYDPNKGMVINGRTSAFSQLTSSKITDAIRKRSETNPQVWDWYKHWAVNEASTYLRDMAHTWAYNVAAVEKGDAVNQFSPATVLHRLGNSFIPEDVLKAPNHEFYWDSQTHQLGLMDNKGNVLPDNAWRLNTALFRFRNANKYFSSLANIAKAEGTDPDALIFQTLKQVWPTDPESEKVFQAITNSRMKNEKLPEGK